MNRNWKYGALGLFLIGMSLSVCVARNKTDGQREITPRGDLLPEEKATIDVFQKATQSVVYITSLAMAQNYLTLDVMEIPQGAGSGFIWDEEGHVVTNFHVIQQAEAAEVTLSDQTKWPATLVGVAPDKDIAVLKIKAPREKMKPIPVGTSTGLLVGQKVMAIGNPFGLDQTLTTGVISAIGRRIQSLTRRPIQGVIQTDAAINPGNSGGPLLDSAGRLIGINTAIYSPSGAYAGVGFAVPVDVVRKIVPQLISKGKIARPGLGISIVEDYIANRMGIEGVIIGSVSLKGPADRAGLRGPSRDNFGRLKLGDVITRINQTQIKDSDDLFEALEKLTVGEKIQLEILRDNKKQTLSLTLAAI